MAAMSVSESKYCIFQTKKGEAGKDILKVNSQRKLTFSSEAEQNTSPSKAYCRRHEKSEITTTRFFKVGVHFFDSVIGRNSP